MNHSYPVKVSLFILLRVKAKMGHSTNETTWYTSPVGWIEITTQAEGISSLIFREPKIEIQPPGSPFQLQVWNELLKIPYGQVITYRDLAKRLHGSTYTRIVAQANARNPLSILIPCHRVIGMNGALTGYGGGLWRKKFLLELEQKGSHSDFSPTLF